MHPTNCALNYPSFTPFIYPREGDGQKWQRIRCVWNEKESELQHKIAFAINTETGEVYSDCTKEAIWVKCAALTLIRPIHTIIIRTAYHVFFPLSLPREISSALLESQRNYSTRAETVRLVACKVFRSFQDIFRSPLYGVILTTISLAGVLIGPFAPQKLYDIRAFYGKVERLLQRGRRFGPWGLAPCFSPISDLEKVSKDSRSFVSTDYSKTAAPRGLSNLAAGFIIERRANELLPPHKPYTSANFIP